MGSPFFEFSFPGFPYYRVPAVSGKQASCLRCSVHTRLGRDRALTDARFHSHARRAAPRRYYWPASNSLDQHAVREQIKLG